MRSFLPLLPLLCLTSYASLATPATPSAAHTATTPATTSITSSLSVSHLAYEKERGFFILAEYRAPKGARILESSAVQLHLPEGFERTPADKNIPRINPETKQSEGYETLRLCWIVIPLGTAPAEATFTVTGSLDLDIAGEKKKEPSEQSLQLKTGKATASPRWSDTVLAEMREMGSAAMQYYAQRHPEDAQHISLIFAPASDETPEEVAFIPWHAEGQHRASCTIGALEKHEQGYRLPLRFTTPPQGRYLRGTLVWRGGHTEVNAFIES